ncbi:site-2 protease family protein [Georgenia sp. Z1491]|uniref:site-2 protease family protein n=1 Tax=Georgenia sp. Z1491 TaxID=3416707 RepID=UPI003CEE76D0
MHTEPRRTPGLVVARVAGAPVVLTWSWLLLVVVVALVYGRILARPEQSGLVMGLLAALAVSIAVLVHELGHGLTGAAVGLRPKEFVLTFVGGHTAFDGTGRGPWAAAAVTAAGPAANLLLAGAGLLVAPLVEGVSPWAAAVDVAVVMNVVLALFNLVPALPLDGGRLWLEVAEGLTGRPLAGLRPLGVLGCLLALVVVGAAVVLFVRFGGWPGLIVVAAAASAGATLWSGGAQAVRDAGRLRRERGRDTGGGPGPRPGPVAGTDTDRHTGHEGDHGTAPDADPGPRT